MTLQLRNRFVGRNPVNDWWKPDIL